MRAEDSRSGSSGPCNGRNFDDNIIKKDGSPTGPVTDLFFDDFESGTGNWDISAHLNWNNSQSHSANYSAHSGNLDYQVCDTLSLINTVNLPPTNLSQLHFWTYYLIEKHSDGGIMEGSVDVTNWTKLNLTPDYPVIIGYPQSCIAGGEPAFSSSSLKWSEYVSDLSAYAGGNFWLRFNYVTNYDLSLND